MAAIGGITSEEEEQQLEELDAWMDGQGLPRGEIAYDFADPESGAQQAVFDLAWPHGIQEELSPPVAVLLNEGSDVIALANQAGYRCFVSVADFKRYVQTDILGSETKSDTLAGDIMPGGDFRALSAGIETRT